METGATQEIFSNPIHPYTQSLLSAVPLPNPIVEKKRQLITYDSSKIDYKNCTVQKVSDSHFVMI